MMDPAALAVDPSTPRARAAACPARLYDCRCGRDDHTRLQGVSLAHTCSIPGCGAIWLDTGALYRLPGWSTLRFQRTGLRAA